MPAAVQTSVLDTLKSAQDASTGNLNVNVSTISVATISGTVVVSTITNPVTIGTLPALAAGTAVIGHVIVDTAPTTAVTGTFFQSVQPTKEANSTVGTLTSVSASITSTQLLALNTSRLGAYIYNDSASNLYVALTTSATSTAFTVMIPANGFYELPSPRLFTSAVFGVWLTATGSARVTELS